MQRKFCELLVSEPQLTQLQVYERAGYSTRNQLRWKPAAS
jgi:hypothetical protein